MTSFNSMVKRMNGIAFLAATFHLPVFPHMMPNAEKRNPDNPIVCSVTNMGRKLAATAATNERVTSILFFILQSTIRLMSRWNKLT